MRRQGGTHKRYDGTESREIRLRFCSFPPAIHWKYTCTPTRTRSTQQRSPLSLDHASSSLDDGDERPEHGKQAQEEKGQGRPVDEPVSVAWSLMLEDGQERKRDDRSRCNVSLAVQGVACRGTFEEDQSNKDDNVREDAWLVRVGVFAECSKPGDDGQDDGQTVPE